MSKRQLNNLSRKNSSIVYINYSPYENSGKILDYVVDTFTDVFHFSIGFHNLKNKKNYNRLIIFENGEQEKEYELFQLPVPTSLVFILLPIRSLINFIQIIGYTLWLKNKYKTIDIYFTVNAFIAWIGNLLRGFGVVEKTVFWVWDYYPPIHENKIIMLMRYIYWQFDKISSYSDKVAFVNRRLLNLRIDLGIYKRGAKHPIVPIATEEFPYSKRKNMKEIRFGFIGVLKKSHGIGIIFDHAKALLKAFGEINYDIIGSGPDEDYFKRRASKLKIKTKFHGYLEGESFNSVLKKCTLGIATYVPDPTNVSYYGDPGKIKRYISWGIPVITTDVLEFAGEVQYKKAGIIIDYEDASSLVSAVKKIKSNYTRYSKNAYSLAKKYYYKKIYPEMFDFSKHRS